MTWIKEEFTSKDLQRLLSKLAENVKAFNGLSPSELTELLADSEKCTYEAGDNIVKEGNVGTHMYVIIDGEALVGKKGQGGNVELARLCTADSFGEMAMADREVRSATVKALSHCVLVRINDNAMGRNPEIAMKVYRNIASVLSERLRNADELLAWRL